MEKHKALELNKILKERIRYFNSQNTINDKNKYRKIKIFLSSSYFKFIYTLQKIKILIL